MLLRKQGFPEEGEFVMCTVSSVQPNGVFVRLDEYDKVGMINISEVSPGRIRNIRDFVKEGKIIVCKVLRVNLERNHIDLSLRRVSEGMRRNKVNEIKQEQKSEKILEFMAKKLKMPPEKLYSDIFQKISKKYSSLNSCFEDVSADAFNLEEAGIDKKISADLTALIKERIKPTQIEVKKEISLSTYSPEGIEAIKSILMDIEKYCDISYLGGGRYSLSIVSIDYKEANKKMEDIEKKLEQKTREKDIKMEILAEK